MAFIAVLAFRPEPGNLVPRVVRLVQPCIAQPVATNRMACRIRPDIAGQDLEQLGLARAIGTEHQPTLAGTHGP